MKNALHITWVWHNGDISPQKRQCELESYYPARIFVKPPMRQALARYACYRIVQNADSSKEVVANGQTYFAVQTRIAEIRQMEEYARLNTENEKRLFLRNELTRHNIQLADVAKNAGVVEPIDYAVFQNHGYRGLKRLK